jgi:hypothetical protein
LLSDGLNVELQFPQNQGLELHESAVKVESLARTDPRACCFYGFLVPYKPVEVPLKFLQGGIKYDDLSDEEKEEWDAIEGDEEKEDVPDAVDAAALNK